MKAKVYNSFPLTYRPFIHIRLSTHFGSKLNMLTSQHFTSHTSHFKLIHFARFRLSTQCEQNLKILISSHLTLLSFIPTMPALSINLRDINQLYAIITATPWFSRGHTVRKNMCGCLRS